MNDSWIDFCFSIAIGSITAIVVWVAIGMLLVFCSRAMSPGYHESPVPSASTVCTENHGVNIFAVAQTKMRETCEEGRFDFTNFDRPFLIAQAEDFDFSVVYLTKENVFPLRIVELVFLDGKIARTKFYAIKDSDGFNGTNRERFFVSRDKNDSYSRLSLRW